MLEDFSANVLKQTHLESKLVMIWITYRTRHVYEYKKCIVIYYRFRSENLPKDYPHLDNHAKQINELWIITKQYKFKLCCVLRHRCVS